MTLRNSPPSPSSVPPAPAAARGALHRCPAVLIAAPASGQGKTTVTAALARLLARQGWRVQVFKCGPDFLDPHWLSLASGRPADNLDLWLNGEDDVRARLHAAAGRSDVILIEGVMGLFDGRPSAADLAVRLGLPVLAVVDASGMAGTFAAVVHGLRHYHPRLAWAGVLANRVGGEGHTRMLQDCLGAHAAEGAAAIAAGWLGALPRQAQGVLPERHLGLTSSDELPDALARLDALADALAATPLGRLDRAGWQRWAVEFPPPAPVALPPLLAGRTIAIARDAAFSFIYPANLELLQALGARLAFFSPLADEPLPECAALWLPGGYPELHAQVLACGAVTRASLAVHVAIGRPVWAECGGMMPLFEQLVLQDGSSWPMWGTLPGRVRMHDRLVALGPQSWDTGHGVLRGHSFHHSSTETPMPSAASTVPASDWGRPEAVYARGAIRASYFHAWFASDPRAAAQLFLPQGSLR